MNKMITRKIRCSHATITHILRKGNGWYANSRRRRDRNRCGNERNKTTEMEAIDETITRTKTISDTKRSRARKRDRCKKKKKLIDNKRQVTEDEEGSNRRNDKQEKYKEHNKHSEREIGVGRKKRRLEKEKMRRTNEE